MSLQLFTHEIIGKVTIQAIVEDSYNDYSNFSCYGIYLYSYWEIPEYKSYEDFSPLRYWVIG